MYPRSLGQQRLLFGARLAADVHARNALDRLAGELLAEAALEDARQVFVGDEVQRDACHRN